jgi:hypothetical protein
MEQYGERIGRLGQFCDVGTIPNKEPQHGRELRWLETITIVAYVRLDRSQFQSVSNQTDESVFAPEEHSDQRTSA